MMVLNHTGVATGWALASGNVQERWVAELLFRIRASVPGVQGPLDAQKQRPKVTPPEEWMATVPSGGAASDKWLAHWAPAYDARVCPLPKAAPRAQRRWWSAARQVVETTFAHVSESFGLTYPGAHSTWGLLMRVAAKVAA